MKAMLLPQSSTADGPAAAVGTAFVPAPVYRGKARRDRAPGHVSRARPYRSATISIGETATRFDLRAMTPASG